MSTENPFGWVEIPVTDMARAKTFYQRAFGFEFQDFQIDGDQMSFFPADHTQSGAAGALVQNENYRPSGTDGVMVYYSVTEVATTLKAIAEHGGKVLREKMSIGDHGFIGIFVDSEGNRLGLHSMR